MIVALGLVAGCEAKKSLRGTLVDLATLDPVRTAFDAHAGEARFIALLSPT